MAKRTKHTSDNSSPQPSRFREHLADAVRYAQQEAMKTSDPKLQALYETAAEVLDGLIKACDHAEQKSEPAWT